MTHLGESPDTTGSTCFHTFSSAVSLTHSCMCTLMPNTNMKILTTTRLYWESMLLQRMASRGQAPLGLVLVSERLLHQSLSVLISLNLSFSVDPPELQSSKCRHFHNILMTRASGQVGVALRSCHWRCGNADDCCGDLAALAVQRCWLIYAHVQTGATAGENVRKSWIRIILEKRFGQKMNRGEFCFVPDQLLRKSYWDFLWWKFSANLENVGSFVQKRFKF